MKLLLHQIKSKMLLFFLSIMMSSSTISAKANSVTAISISPQSATVLYETVSSGTYTLTPSPKGNGCEALASAKPINWTAPAVVSDSGIQAINLLGNGQTVIIMEATTSNLPSGTTSFTI